MSTIMSMAIEQQQQNDLYSINYLFNQRRFIFNTVPLICYRKFQVWLLFKRCKSCSMITLQN